VTHGEAFQVLGLKVGASLAAVRKAHDELQAQWQADRHAQSPEEAAIAETRRGEIVAALSQLAPPLPQAPAAPPAEAPAVHVEPGVEIPWRASQGRLPMPGAPAPLTDSVQRARRRAAGVRNMLVGGGLALVGVVITALTHEAAVANGGGTYLVMYGPMVAGGILFLQGLLGFASA
jgi:hypothetical protein